MAATKRLDVLQSQLGNKKLASIVTEGTPRGLRFPQYGIPKETDIVTKYNSNAASVYRDRIQALAEGRPWQDPPVVKESVKGGGGRRKLPLNGSNGNDNGGSAPMRSKSSEDIQVEADKNTEFVSEKPPPSHGGKFVGFESTTKPIHKKTKSHGDVLSLKSQGFWNLSSAAHSDANVVQSGTKFFSSKVEGGNDIKVHKTANVVATMTSEISRKTWGVMKGHTTKEDTANTIANENDDWVGWDDANDHFHNCHSSNDWDKRGTIDNTKDEATKAVANENDNWAGWNDANEQIQNGEFDNKSACHN
ncbi:hypothetical protein F3Y22_tig00117056pilonHSYRG01395 [Hibiscus syriacus]|uniref:Uncharacterized protein n=1 Tax=Hibiscus syriacus TaxID=106335 RepID=A0A6A2WX76_HIBSY|nr:hypothetical protein F3Y22_tig00117056pilonHSYRG01395 [Hibiscus syriacus]